ncbi:MAG TPA: 2Fe-2S iron-sulfur cluster-binding protein [Chloroflexia bacterium]|nr:2Fe-2S iron-sulfur cluster-binding protein [Chloroflexia bacterium]
MATITILPSGLKIEVAQGSNILKAVSEQKVCWPSTCGGKAECTTCAYVVISGSENLSPMSRLEQHQLVARKGRMALAKKMRLACQSTINGDITIQKNLMIL